MVNECLVPQDLCDIARGDTVPFGFTFKQPDGTPLPIAGMVLWFTAKLDPETELDPAAAIQQNVTFPVSPDSTAGIGSMKVLPAATELLIPGEKYKFDFQLTNGPDDVFTVGEGSFKCKQDVTLTAP